MNDLTWYALRTLPQKEFAAELTLRARDFTVFLPTETKWRRHNRFAKRKTAHTYPMFVRYLFVGLTAPTPADWSTILALKNMISGVVGSQDRFSPAPIAHDAIDRLMKMSGATVPHRSSVNPHKSIRPGDDAEITCGQFRGHIAKVQGLSGQKARIMLSLFGAERLVEINIAQLDAA